MATVARESAANDRVQTLTRRASSVSLAIDNMSERFTVGVMSVSKIHALRKSVMRQHDSVAKILLACKESLDKKAIIESAFRACKEAFLEVSAVLLHTLEESDGDKDVTVDRVKEAMRKILREERINDNV